MRLIQELLERDAGIDGSPAMPAVHGLEMRAARRARGCE